MRLTQAENCLIELSWLKAEISRKAYTQRSGVSTAGTETYLEEERISELLSDVLSYEGEIEVLIYINVNIAVDKIGKVNGSPYSTPSEYI